MKITYVQAPGFLYDLFYIFVCRFNEEMRIEAEKSACSAEEAAAHIRSVIDRFSPIPDDLHLFFRLKKHGRSFMSQCYFAGFDGPKEQLCVGEIIKRLGKRDEFIKKLVRFYFPEYDARGEAKDLLRAVSPLIDASDYDERTKRELYSFLVDPDGKINSLVCELKDKEKRLDDYYKEEYQKIVEAQSITSDPDDFFKKICGRVDGLGTAPAPAVIYRSVCLLNRHVLYAFGEDTLEAVILGYLYDFDAPKDKGVPILSLRDFGEILSEPNRLSIIELIKERGEVTAKDLEKNLNFTGSTAYYHVTMMLKAGMLKTRVSGRTVFYRLNPKYFEGILAQIVPLSEKTHNDG